MVFRIALIWTLVFSLFSTACSDDGTTSGEGGSGPLGSSLDENGDGSGDSSDNGEESSDEPICSDLTLDDPRAYDVADRPHLMAFDIPSGFSEIVTVEEERVIDAALGFPTSPDNAFHALVQYQVAQGDEPVDPDERRSSLLAQEGAEVWGSIDWNGESVDVIVVDVFDLEQAHLTVPVETDAGTEYFGLLFQYQVLDDECLPEIRSLFDAILETWEPNDATTFAG